MIDVEWLKLLCCPETHQGLVEATEADLRRINEQALAGKLSNRGGQLITEPMEALLVREDGLVGYPVRQGIPVMLMAEAVVFS